MDIEHTLEERGKNYGDFKDHAALAQRLKELVKFEPVWEQMTPTQREAMDMILHKIARIMNGNPYYIDSWHDIAGYATLVVQNLEQSHLDKIGKELDE